MDILLLEDAQWYSDALAGDLRKAGHQVTTASKFDEAVDCIMDSMPEAIISDYDLGDPHGRTGSDFLGDVQADCRSRGIQTPILILHSGLSRDIPEGVRFVSKGNPLKLYDIIGEQ